MNYSTAIFLINQHARAVKAVYEDGHPAETFKTLDPTIKVNDFVIVQTTTRHNMTVCKITEVDVDIDFDSSKQISWVIDKIERFTYERLFEQEAQAIQAIKSAELRKKREDLKNALLADSMDKIKALPIASMNGDADIPPVEPPSSGA